MKGAGGWGGGVFRNQKTRHFARTADIFRDVNCTRDCFVLCLFVCLLSFSCLLLRVLVCNLSSLNSTVLLVKK